jgi:sortase A
LPPVADAPPAQPTGGPQLPAAPTEPAAERWMAERLAADRAATAGIEPADDRFAGYWATDRPGKRPARPASDEPGRPADEAASGTASRGAAGRPGDAGEQRPGAAAPNNRAGSDRASGRTAGRPGTDERFAGYWVAEGPEAHDEEHPAGRRSTGGTAARRRGEEDGERRFAGPRQPGSRAAGGEQAGGERFAGYWARDPGGREGAVRGEPTEEMGPFDLGAWSRDAAVSPARTRGRERPTEGPEPVTEDRDDVTGAGGGGGEQPPHRSGRGGGGPQRPRRTFGNRIRTFLRGIGQTFITLGLVLLLLAVYEVWFTDVVNHRTQKDLTTALQKQWDAGDDPTVGAVPTRPGEKVRSIPLGDGFALIYIPDFGTDYVFTVIEGTGADDLNKGPGHYVDTPLPGAIGNVAIAGHRVGKGSPFLNLDKLKAGSAIVIRTKSYWYTYRVVGDPGATADAVSALGFPGREIVDPSDVGVIAPVPDKPGAKPTQRLLTLTTCHPKFTARQRMVIHAELDGAPFPVGNGTPPAMTGG